MQNGHSCRQFPAPIAIGPSPCESVGSIIFAAETLHAIAMMTSGSMPFPTFIGKHWLSHAIDLEWLRRCYLRRRLRLLQSQLR
jgi:hypothetical protein